MVWETSPGLATFMIALMLVESLMPAALVWIGKTVVDAVASVPRGTSGALAEGTRVLVPVGMLYAALTTIRHLMAPLLAVVQGQLNDLLVAGVNTRLIAKANSFGDLLQFEDAQFYDRLQTIQREAAWRPMNLLAFSTQVFHHGIVLASMVVVLTRFHPLLVIVLAVTTIPHVIIERRLHQATWTGITALATDHRRMAY
jgi:ATP-binding cassette subfamily B protein